ncbi:16S rRNA (guanine(527)-N(7))-methyltransferase RsmG [Microlunatus sp. Gsoil 973]|uniref:16S rRNA (guanine(527)-N(7))-methyltransferase RsmG n=1 Tax=Microlunatus sp. Gsoil 973 TaxID=2672569 RepID=UPI0012B45EFA|nr:16S rRNA (guanine(527)-N(7))-methyltransferase RsmG [Microlunatus sp. Gsoil 973]QGN34529.1 16S rRNA (guanine(527)-N(7))-methyltransferase RsmG [Microlunatus sp. Gsoil 973]
MSIDLAREVFPDFERISQYVDILADRGISWGLIGPREADRLWDRHVLNSVAMSDLVADGVSVIDVGSGAGLPGVPLAIRRPDLDVTLLEPLLRRANFLTEVIGELDLGDRVRVVRARAEDHDGRYDVVTARAVAPLPRLLTWCLPLMGSTGELLALKGSSAASEIDQARQVLDNRRLHADVISVRAHPRAESTQVVRVRPVR